MKVLLSTSPDPAPNGTGTKIEATAGVNLFLTVTFLLAIVLLSLKSEAKSHYNSFFVVPVLGSIEGTALAYSEGQAATIITATLTAADIDNANAISATVRISNNFAFTEDALLFVNASGITGSYDGTTGILTLTGISSLANYQAALRSVRYQNINNNNPSTLTRTVSITLNDGTGNSNTVTRNINISAVNDAPVLANVEPGSLSYTESQAATAITSSITVNDVDHANLTSATIQISAGYVNGQDILAFTTMGSISGSFNAGSGTLTLSGSATLADYEAALKAVTYRNSNNGNPSTANRTISFRVSDGTSNSAIVTRLISFTATNDAPVLAAIEATSLAYTEAQAATVITGTTTAVDVDNTNLSGATIQITGNYTNGEDILSFTAASGISGTFDASTGTLTLTGAATVAAYQTALRSVRFNNSNTANPSTLQRTLSFLVTDGTDNSNTVSRTINLTATNDLPVLAAIEAASLVYAEDQAATAITSSITVADVDNPNLASATVQITGAYSNGQDVLAFANTANISGTFTPATGLMTLTGAATVAEYQAALRAVTYQNTNTVNPSSATRTITFRVNDGVGNSNTQTRTIIITLSNDAPVLAAIEGAGLAYSEGQAAAVVTATTTVSDLDNTNLTGAIVQITGNYVMTEDVLSFTNAFGVTGSYNAATGTMTLTGTSSVGNYQNAIRNVRYRNTNNNTPSPLTRTVSYTVSDATLTSNTVTRNILVSPVNDAPTVVNNAATVEEETSVVVDVLANDNDVDDTIDPTTVAIATAPVNGTTSIDPVTGAITYTPNANFSGTNTFTYNVRDQFGSISLNATVTITVTNINDAPSFTAGPDITVDEDAGTWTVTNWATALNDGDPFTSQTLTFVISNSNTALFNSGPSINGSTGTLTFRSSNNASGTATITVYVRDNGLSTPPPNVNVSDTKTFTITVRPVNDAPNAVDDFYSTSSNTPLTANSRSNDTDTEGNALTTSAMPVVPPANGSVAILSNGNFTYTPNASFTGTDTFTYEVCDNGTDNGVPASRCDQAVVSITVNPPNPYFNIVGNNSIEISSHCFILTKALNNQQGAVWQRAPLDLRYSFELNYDAIFSDSGVVRDVGADGIIFLLQRDDTPPPLNTPSSPIDARGSVGEYLGVGGISPSIGIEVDTYQNGGEPAFDHIALSRDGSVYNIVSGPVSAAADASNIEDGISHTVRITWDKPTTTLKVYFDGVERISHTEDIVNTVFGGIPTGVYCGFSASTGGQNNYQGVCGIDMQTINLPPLVGTYNLNVNEDSSADGVVLGSDSDPEEIIVTAVAETKPTPHGNVVIRADGTYTYTPNPDYFGTDAFTYQACDTYSTAGCSTGTVNVTINPINDPPSAVADNATVAEESSVVISVLTNDIDIDNAIDATTVIVTIPPTNGTATVNATTGEVTYTPNATFVGSDTFSYTIRDIDGATSTVAAVSVSVTNVNDAPVAADDNAIAIESMNTSITVLANDTDIDDNVLTSQITILINPSHGMVSVSNGTIIYLANTGYLGNDSFSYSITDVGGLTSNEATVQVTVIPPNRPPDAVDDGPIAYASVLPLTIDILGNDSDPDNDLSELTIVSVTQPAFGIVTIENGQLIYQPQGFESGTLTFTYVISDPEGLTDEATVVINYEYLPVMVSEGFSPNGDAHNSFLYIRSIESFPKNSMKVYDRWGILVYQISNYDNASVRWDGFGNAGMESGKLLQQGTYYYLLDLGNSSTILSGYITIIR